MEHLERMQDLDNAFSSDELSAWAARVEREGAAGASYLCEAPEGRRRRRSPSSTTERPADPGRDPVRRTACGHRQIPLWRRPPAATGDGAAGWSRSCRRSGARSIPGRDLRRGQRRHGRAGSAVRQSPQCSRRLALAEDLRAPPPPAPVRRCMARTPRLRGRPAVDGLRPLRALGLPVSDRYRVVDDLPAVWEFIERTEEQRTRSSTRSTAWSPQAPSGRLRASVT